MYDSTPTEEKPHSVTTNADADGETAVEDECVADMLSHLEDDSGESSTNSADCRNCSLPAAERSVRREISDRGSREHSGKQCGWTRKYEPVRVCPECGERLPSGSGGGST